MINQSTYDGLRDRYRATGEIGAELYELLVKLGRIVIYASAVPPSLSPSGTWDADSIQDATHGWMERRLLRTGALLAAFDRATSPRPFLRSLEQNFRHHLENERSGSEIDNLVRRAHQLLREDDRFRAHIEMKRPSDTWWGLGTWTEAEPYQGNDDVLVSHAWALGDFSIVRYSAHVDRASPILSGEELSRFLAGLLERLEFLLTLRHFAFTLERRFNLSHPQLVELDQELPDETEADGATAEEISRAALNVAAELTGRQFEVLRRKKNEETLDEIADAMGIARGTADNDLKSAGRAIEKRTVDGVRRIEVLEKLLND